jgi:hypothetical protein
VCIYIEEKRALSSLCSFFLPRSKKRRRENKTTHKREEKKRRGKKRNKRERGVFSLSSSIYTPPASLAQSRRKRSIIIAD